ncbi:hypothetical protein QBC37DRAFT_405562 [Rhypophila decipiens]|uniref:Uncharacterized protein n=1 Tax=Rhypophila decipiens TaxID=261697 RepID=A0AAN7B2S1_9PEZI|nr:hypothetical protein QBC37DRAFT_405562 [Rhypophila decipiens]
MLDVWDDDDNSLGSDPFAEDEEADKELEAEFGVIDLTDDGHIPQNAHLPAQFDENAMKRAVKYDDLAHVPDEEPTIPFEEDIRDDIDDDKDWSPKLNQQTAAPSFDMLPPPAPRTCQAEVHAARDESQLVPHMRSREDITDFESALGLNAHFMGQSGMEWESLRQILQLARDRDGRPINDMIDRLTRRSRTLKNKIRNRLPLLPMREVNVPLLPEKMPTRAKAEIGPDFPQRLDLLCLW